MCEHSKFYQNLFSYFQGAIQACDALIEKMKPVKDKLNNPTWETLINACYNASVYLSASGL